jgi:hypothetical protein
MYPLGSPEPIADRIVKDLKTSLSKVTWNERLVGQYSMGNNAILPTKDLGELLAQKLNLWFLSTKQPFIAVYKHESTPEVRLQDLAFYIAPELVINPKAYTLYVRQTTTHTSSQSNFWRSKSQEETVTETMSIFAQIHAQKIERELDWQEKNVCHVSLQEIKRSISNDNPEVQEDIDLIGRLTAQELNRSFANSKKDFKATYIDNMSNERTLSNLLADRSCNVDPLEKRGLSKKYSPISLLPGDEDLTIRIEKKKPDISLQESTCKKIQELNREIAYEKSEPLMNLCTIAVGVFVFTLGVFASNYSK